MMAEKYGFVHIPVSQLISEKHLWDERDEARDCTIYNEDMLDEEIRRCLDEHTDGGLVFDFHCPDIVNPEDVDFVVVLRCDNEILWKRLASRGYSEAKIQENITAEIFQTILDEATEYFPEEMVVEIASNEIGDLDTALERIGELTVQN
jgi:adenylate kinase